MPGPGPGPGRQAAASRRMKGSVEGKKEKLLETPKTLLSPHFTCTRDGESEAEFQPEDFEGKPEREKKHASFTLCNVCNIQLNSAAQAQIHYHGKSHQKRLKQLCKGMPKNDNGGDWGLEPGSSSIATYIQPVKKQKPIEVKSPSVSQSHECLFTMSSYLSDSQCLVSMLSQHIFDAVDFQGYKPKSLTYLELYHESTPHGSIVLCSPNVHGHLGQENKSDPMVLKTLQESTVMVFYCKCKWIIEIKLSFNCVNSCS
ncbi:uncharacterized protein LOC132535238 [Erinaceus europaeus]|uniref:Uncharacterized protein LOC132535238 n=1 Tax=Erinaceus europaeus TaxID=9365 RepID=A0ABM3WI07_ERIEU|nr:uncharacterized protein LOC132535238 [Erinaceus europaeus]